MTAAPWPLPGATAAQLRRFVVCPPSGRTTDRDSGSGGGSGGGGSSVVAPPAAGRCPLRGGVGEMPTPRPRRADRTGGRAAMATGSAASSRRCTRRSPHLPRLGGTMAPRGAGSGAATAGATAPRRGQLRRLLAPPPPPPPAAHCGRAGALAATPEAAADGAGGAPHAGGLAANWRYRRARGGSRGGPPAARRPPPAATRPFRRGVCFRRPRRRESGIGTATTAPVVGLLTLVK